MIEYYNLYRTEHVVWSMLRKINETLNDEIDRMTSITFVLWALAPLTFLVGLIEVYAELYISAAVNIISSITGIVILYVAKMTGNWKLASFATSTLGFMILCAGAYEKLNSVTFTVWLPLYPVFFVMIGGSLRGILWTGLSFAALNAFYGMNYYEKIPVLEFMFLPLALFSSAPLISYYDHSIQKMFQELKSMAYYDPLTGLMNRRSFIENLKLEIARSRREHAPLSLMMIDIDFFKKINDEFGHDAGDRVLEEISGKIRASIRESDTAARYGGEEFIVLCPGSTLTGASLLAKKLSESIKEIDFPKQVSISIGTTILEELDDIDSICKKADIALYEAKKNGRDCNVVYSASLV
ncbi:MAG: GGDEF domain-containing protein [Spirochaetia bacterium]|nr:GGDEF domain-containing protein [Spirochaetia bacterium]